MVNKMSKNKEYIKNTAILMIGKFATQFITFLLIPLYTHYLLTDDYGFVDLCQTYISLFVPVLTLRLDSSIFRFLIDKRKDEEGKKRIISNSLFVLFISILFTILVMIPILFFVNIKYAELIVLNIVILMISSVFLQILRGLGKNKEYSINSIITGGVTLVVNLILILAFDFGADSILISSIVANILCILYVAYKIRIKRLISMNYVNKKDIKDMLSYSIPMIPNSLSWWLINVSDRTIISIFLGTAVNGVYAISCKFSNLLNSFWFVFNMSWQESVSLHINDDDAEKFITDMGNRLLFVFASVSLLIIGALPLVYSFVIGDSYIDSYNYIPILLFANILNVLSSIIGGIYVGLKKTKEIANTTIVSAIINLIINLLLIKYIGLLAAAISTLISYLLVSVYRYVDCKKYINFKLNYSKLFVLVIIFVLSSIMYIFNNIYINLLNLFLVVIYSIYANREYLIYLKDKFIAKKSRKVIS